MCHVTQIKQLEASSKAGRLASRTSVPISKSIFLITSSRKGISIRKPSTAWVVTLCDLAGLACVSWSF